jgi:hypothetical protein
MTKRTNSSRKKRIQPGWREIRLIVPDARSPSVRRRIAAEVAALDPKKEEDAMRWIEAVSRRDTSEKG